MCKLSLNIVLNVYNSLKSSFLSFAWPWPGRSLPKGNQWEWWDPQQGSLPGLGEVGHSPGWTSGSAGAQCGEASSPLATPMHPWHPLHTPNSPQHPQFPLMPPIPLLAPEYLYSLPAPQYTPNGPQCPLCHLYPIWPWSTYSLLAPNTPAIYHL